jgi:hypothetical protein
VDVLGAVDPTLGVVAASALSAAAAVIVAIINQRRMLTQQIRTMETLNTDEHDRAAAGRGHALETMMDALHRIEAKIDHHIEWHLDGSRPGGGAEVRRDEA